MGWKSSYRLERKKLTEQERQTIKDRAKAREQEEAQAAKGLRSSIHPYLGAEWQEVLVATGTRVGEWKGQRTLLMDGKPTSVQAIREKCAKIIADASSQDHPEDLAAEQPCQSTHQSTAKVVPLRQSRSHTY